MALVVITPWRDQAELLKVRNWLFPPNAGGQDRDLRRKACSQIQAWKLRGGIPHAVESTWYITDAILTDNVHVSSISALSKQACYCTVLCRFVTGLLDSEQDSKYKISMYDKAKELDLPASFVELRHEAIHGELPSLVVLRQAAERALRWLWNDYWRCLDDGGSSKIDETYLSNEMRDVLETHVAECTEFSKATKQRTEKLPAQKVTVTALKLVDLCKASKQALSCLIDTLVTGAMLIPSDTRYTREADPVRFEQNMDEWFVVWDQLLEELAEKQQDQFLKRLMNAMMAQLVTPQATPSPKNMLQKGVFAWLEHIYTSQTWQKAVKRSGPDDMTMMSACLQNPNNWTVPLASMIIQCSTYKQFQQRFGPLVTKAMQNSIVPEKGPQEQGKDVNTEAQDDFDGWQRTQRSWRSTPIGC